jgi:polyisoprenoid-binding protein YceI
VTFTAQQQGAPFSGEFKTFDADISFDSADLAHSSVVATVDVGSFDSKSSDRDTQVKDATWFNVAKFPQARFVSKSFRDLGGGKYEAVGVLTIRDVSKDAVLPFTLKIDGSVAHMNGTLAIVRTDYGVGQGEWATSSWVGKDVKVDVKLVADKQ